MTNKEAIGIMKGYKIYALGKHDWQDAFDFAVEALEKQIPKKPDYIREHNVIYFDWQCSHCKREYVNSTYGIAHCVDCGQAIDWREENDK